MIIIARSKKPFEKNIIAEIIYLTNLLCYIIYILFNLNLLLGSGPKALQVVTLFSQLQKLQLHPAPSVTYCMATAAKWNSVIPHNATHNSLYFSIFCATSSPRWVSNQLISLAVYNSNAVGLPHFGDDLFRRTTQVASDHSSRQEIYKKNRQNKV